MNTNNSKNINIVKIRHKPIRKVVICNIGISVINYITTKCKFVLQKSNKIAPIEDEKFTTVYV
jgi:hypothetical protein